MLDLFPGSTTRASIDSELTRLFDDLELRDGRTIELPYETRAYRTLRD